METYSNLGIPLGTYSITYKQDKLKIPFRLAWSFTTDNLLYILDFVNEKPYRKDDINIHFPKAKHDFDCSYFGDIFQRFLLNSTKWIHSQLCLTGVMAQSDLYSVQKLLGKNLLSFSDFRAEFHADCKFQYKCKYNTNLERAYKIIIFLKISKT